MFSKVIYKRSSSVRQWQSLNRLCSHVRPFEDRASVTVIPRGLSDEGDYLVFAFDAIDESFILRLDGTPWARALAREIRRNSGEAYLYLDRRIEGCIRMGVILSKEIHTCGL